MIPTPQTRSEPYIYFYVHGRTQGVPIEWWGKLQGPKPPRGYHCDGCTVVPDSFKTLQWWPACVIHDYHYDWVGPDIDRWEADWTFRFNLRKLLVLQEAKSRWVYTLPTLYWAGVRARGHKHYKRSPF